MHEIHDHKINPANETLRIAATDEPGPGGAFHRYEISGFDLGAVPSSAEPDATYDDNSSGVTLFFQNGAINEVGVNGITHEALIAIVLDRLRAFQGGPYACRENALAITKLEEAQHWLHHRTLARMVRGVEGTMKV